MMPDSDFKLTMSNICHVVSTKAVGDGDASSTSLQSDLLEGFEWISSDLDYCKRLIDDIVMQWMPSRSSSPRDIKQYVSPGMSTIAYSMWSWITRQIIKYDMQTRHSFIERNMYLIETFVIGAVTATKSESVERYTCLLSTLSQYMPRTDDTMHTMMNSVMGSVSLLDDDESSRMRGTYAAGKLLAIMSSMSPEYFKNELANVLISIAQSYSDVCILYVVYHC